MRRIGSDHQASKQARTIEQELSSKNHRASERVRAIEREPASQPTRPGKRPAAKASGRRCGARRFRNAKTDPAAGVRSKVRCFRKYDGLSRCADSLFLFTVAQSQKIRRQVRCEYGVSTSALCPHTVYSFGSLRRVFEENPGQPGTRIIAACEGRVKEFDPYKRPFLGAALPGKLSQALFLACGIATHGTILLIAPPQQLLKTLAE